MNNRQAIRWLLKPAVFSACLIPFALLAVGAANNDLGANPLETVTHSTGDWALRLLLVTLAMTPLRMLTGHVWPIQIRRMLGLFTFFYASVHFLVWLALDQQWQWQAILEDIAERPYVTVGFAAWLLMLPLAITSNRWSMRRLARNWSRLHKLVYPAALLGVLHYLWLVKADWLEPLWYGLILTFLMLFRLPGARQKVAQVLALLKRGVRLGVVGDRT